MCERSSEKCIIASSSLPSPMFSFYGYYLQIMLRVKSVLLNAAINLQFISSSSSSSPDFFFFC